MNESSLQLFLFISDLHVMYVCKCTSSSNFNLKCYWERSEVISCFVSDKHERKSLRRKFMSSSRIKSDAQSSSFLFKTSSSITLSEEDSTRSSTFIQEGRLTLLFTLSFANHHPNPRIAIQTLDHREDPHPLLQPWITSNLTLDDARPVKCTPSLGNHPSLVRLILPSFSRQVNSIHLHLLIKRSWSRQN